MTTLIRPNASMYDDWSAAIAEFATEPGGPVYPAGSGLPPQPTGSREELVELIAKAERFADPTSVLPGRYVRSDHYWIVEDQHRYVGSLMFRHTLNDFLLNEGGHIGYSVRPTRRREGHASRALGLALGRAREVGLTRVLVTCDVGNLASARTIQSQGGVLDDVRRGKERYWIHL